MRRFPALVTSTIVLAALVFTLAAVPRKSPAKKDAHPYGNADAITQQELKTYDYFLASDQIEGRNLPSRGYDLAALYVASHLSEWGLKPGGSTSGTNGPLQPYFIPMDLQSTNPVPSEMKLTVNVPEPQNRGGRGFFGRGARLSPGPHALAYGHAWMVNQARGRNAAPLIGGSFHNAQLVFAGNGYVIGSDNPYQGLDVRGKVVVVAGLPKVLADYQRELAASFSGRGAAPRNPMGPNDLTPEQYAARNGALAVITAPSYAQLSEMDQPQAGALRFGANGPSYEVSKFMPADPPPSVPEIVAGMDTLNALFQDEKVSAAQVMDAAGAAATLPSFSFSPGKTVSGNVAVRTTHDHGEDVMAMLEGSDPVLKNEYVILSAHLDHIGLRDTPNCTQGTPELAAGDVTDGGLIRAADQSDCDGINNGADDDGSGTTGLLGVAHAFATGAAQGLRPKRTIIFLWNAGEEKGLWGSQYFVEFPPIDIHKVVVDLNMDMIGRTKTPGYVDPPSYYLVKPHEVLVVGPDISSNDLEKTLETVNNNFQKLDLNHFYDVTQPDATHDNLGPTARGQRIFYRSDHYNFAKMGIPIAFFSDGLHVDYHRITDTPDKIDYTEIQQVAKTAAAVAWVIGNEPEGATPKLNASLPQQLINDMAAVKRDGWGQLTPVLPPLPGEPF
jgi:Zn-dependent M28 family amino/carboxypeptidase